MRVALFDRLASTGGDPYPATGVVDVGESIRLELERLLNTRRMSRQHGGPMSVIDYGINDWSALYADREEDRRALLRDIRHSIERFEPRLRLTAVEAQTVEGHRRRLLLRIAGHVRNGPADQVLGFVMAFGESGFEVWHE